MFRDRIPPRNLPQLPRPSAEEIDVIKQWISAGAKEFTCILTFGFLMATVELRTKIAKRGYHFS